MILNFQIYVNEATQKVATIANDGRIRQAENKKTTRQKWIRLGSGQDPIASQSLSENSVIDAIGGNPAVKTGLQIYQRHGGANQNWKFASAGTNAEGHDLFYIKADNTDLVWDVPNGHPAEWLGIYTHPLNEGDNQKWRLDDFTVEAVAFESVATSNVADVPGFATIEGYPIQEYTPNGGYNQQWVLRNAGPDLVRIESVSSGLFLEQLILVFPINYVWQFSFADRETQLWRIETVEEVATGDIVRIRNLKTSDYISVAAGSGSGRPLYVLPDAGDDPSQRWKIRN